MITFLRRLFCWHKWQVDPDFDVMAPGIPDFVCAKCGKKEGL